MPPGQPEPAEIFDHELTRILAIHGPELEETSRILLATGAATIARPEVILRVRLRVPSRWRRGLLEIAAEDPASGAALARSASTLAGRARTARRCSMRSRSTWPWNSHTDATAQDRGQDHDADPNGLPISHCPGERLKDMPGSA